uniref:Cysteine sulfinic acid decarboxylase n=1 Tax=Salmo trutta TaxID=8032 RepID=A0A674ES04_SALTR
LTCTHYPELYFQGFLVLVIPGLQVCEWREPEELAALLDLELRENGESQHQLLQRVRAVAKYSVKTNPPHFINQLSAGVEYHVLTVRFLTEALNTSQYTYEVAPVFVLMEDEVLAKLRSLVGWTEGDGIFCPGGSVSNMYAMNVAPYHTFPEVKLKGLWALPPLAVFTSQKLGHYSVTKAAAFQGIGTENVFQIKVDDRGCKIPEDLDEKIELAKSQARGIPNPATSGTTVHGAFNPLEPIADICDRQGLWMHVDCSAIPLKDTMSLLKHCHSFYDMSLDTGDKSIQCGRKVDSIAVVDVESSGLTWLGRAYLVEEITGPIEQPEFVNVCFRFIPPSLRGKENSPDYQTRLSEVGPVIKERMMKQGTMMVGYQPQCGRVNFFRMIVVSPQLSRQDMIFFLDEIERVGNDL